MNIMMTGVLYIETLSALAYAIKHLRLEQGLTQKHLADRCFLHVNCIGKIERGKMDPSLKTLVKLAEGLNCTVEYLVRR